MYLHGVISIWSIGTMYSRAMLLLTRKKGADKRWRLKRGYDEIINETSRASPRAMRGVMIILEVSIVQNNEL